MRTFRRCVIVSEETRDCPLPVKKLHKALGNLLRFFMLQPVASLREGEQFALGAITEAFVGHFCHEEPVALAPQNARGHTYGTVGKRDAITHCGPIPVDHPSK